MDCKKVIDSIQSDCVIVAQDGVSVLVTAGVLCLLLIVEGYRVARQENDLLVYKRELQVCVI